MRRGEMKAMYVMNKPTKIEKTTTVPKFARRIPRTPEITITATRINNWNEIAFGKFLLGSRKPRRKQSIFANCIHSVAFYEDCRSKQNRQLSLAVKSVAF
jgi:hypothetical protein